MIYYECLSSGKQRRQLHTLSDKRKVTKKMNVVCPTGHLAMHNTNVVPDEVWCPFCQESYKNVQVYTQFYGPGPRKLKRLAKKYV